MKTFTEFLAEEKQIGTYAALNFDQKSKNKISEYIREVKIPNAIGKDMFHVTMLYSRVECKGIPQNTTFDSPFECRVKGFEKWESKTGKALVALIDCPALIERHNQ